MKRVMRGAAGVAFCFGWAGWWGPANSQQPNAPELSIVCDQLNIDGERPPRYARWLFPLGKLARRTPVMASQSQTPTAPLERSIPH